MNTIKVLFLYPFSEKARFYWHYSVAKDYTSFLNEALSNKEKIMQSERFKKMAHPPDEKLMRFLPPDELDPIVREEKTFNRCYVDHRKSVIEKELAKMKEIDPNSPFVFEIESQYFRTPQKDVPDTQMSSEIKSESKRPNPTTAKIFWLVLFFISFGIYHFANKTFGIVLQSIIGLIFLRSAYLTDKANKAKPTNVSPVTIIVAIVFIILILLGLNYYVHKMKIF